jgi:hypothetical protein
MEEKTIKAILAVPLALMMGGISAVIAFIAAIIMVLLMLPALTYTPGFEWVGGLGALWVIVIPIVVFVAGFIQGLIVAVVHNFLAPRIGGIKLRFE